MPSLNPCAITAVALFVIGLGVGGVVDHWRMSGEVQSLKAAQATAMAAAERSRADAEAKARKVEQEATQRVTAISDKYQKEAQDAKSQIDRLRADIATGAHRLYVNAICPAAGSVSAASDNPSRASTETRAKLDPATAGQLLGIAADGDAGIRQLNALIDACTAVHREADHSL